MGSGEFRQAGPKVGLRIFEEPATTLSSVPWHGTGVAGNVRGSKGDGTSGGLVIVAEVVGGGGLPSDIKLGSPL